MRRRSIGLLLFGCLLYPRVSPAQSPPMIAAPAAHEEANPIDYDARTRLPTGYHVERRLRPGLVVAGSVVAGLGYLLGASTAASGGCSADHWMWVPVAGPFVALGKDRGACDDPEAFRYAARMWSGIGQGVGGGLLLLAVFHQKDVLVANGKSASRQVEGQRTWALVPELGPSRAAIDVVGTF
jgi:hypothetical protein